MTELAVAKILLQLAVDEMRNVHEAVVQQHETKGWPVKYGTPYGAINGMRETRELILRQAAAAGIELSPHRPPADPPTSVPLPEGPAILGALLDHIKLKHHPRGVGDPAGGLPYIAGWKEAVDAILALRTAGNAQ